MYEYELQGNVDTCLKKHTYAGIREMKMLLELESRHMSMVDIGYVYINRHHVEGVS